MSDSLLNFSEILRRIGVMNRTEVDLSETVRMTVLASDLSHLAPAIPVPVGVFTFDTAAVGAEFSQVAITCQAPGGFFPVGGQINGGSVYNWWVSDTDPFAAATATVSALGIAGGLGTSVVATFRTNVAAQVPAAGGHGLVRGSAASGLYGVPMLIPGGSFLLIESQLTNVPSAFSFAIQEVPAPSRLPATT